MTRVAVALSLLLASVRIASAQPDEPPTPPPDLPTTTTTPETAGTATTAPEPAPMPPPPPARVESGPRRPDGFSIGMGIGYALPTDLQQPNLTSVRFRLASGLTFEPRVVVGLSRQSNDGVATQTLEFGAGADVRWPWKLHGPIDLLLVGGIAIDHTSTNPDGPSNDTSTTSFDLHWGTGLEYWLAAHWSISATAENPLIRTLSTRQGNGTGMMDTTSSTTTVGLIWAPDLFVTGHLYW